MGSPSGPLVLSNAGIYLGGYKLGSHHNEVDLDPTREMKVDTRFGPSNWETCRPGVHRIAVSGGGYHDFSETDVEADRVYFEEISAAEEVMSLTPHGGVQGHIAWLFKTLQAKYTPGGQYGELFRFKVSAQGYGTLVRSIVLENDTLTGSATSTPLQLGAVTAAQKIYAGIHVVSLTGTADFKVQSDNAEAFTTPVDRITFAQFTTIGALLGTADGAITDDWWAVALTLSGGGEVEFFITAGIQ